MGVCTIEGVSERECVCVCMKCLCGNIYMYMSHLTSVLI